MTGTGRDKSGTKNKAPVFSIHIVFSDELRVYEEDAMQKLYTPKYFTYTVYTL